MLGRYAPEIPLQLFKNIPQRRRRGHARLDRKAQPVGLAWTVVRVLPQHHYFYLLQRRGVKSIKYLFGGGVNYLSRLLLGQQEGLEFLHVRLGRSEERRVGKG